MSYIQTDPRVVQSSISIDKYNESCQLQNYLSEQYKSQYKYIDSLTDQINIWIKYMKENNLYHVNFHHVANVMYPDKIYQLEKENDVTISVKQFYEKWDLNFI